MIDYLKSNLDDAILAAVNRIILTKEVTPDKIDETQKSYFYDGLLGLNSTLKDPNSTKDI
jgi:hypothetical protein